MRYSIDFRKKVMALKEARGLSVRQAAEYFNIHFNTVQNWTKGVEHKKTGRPAGKYRRIDRDVFRDFVRTNNSLYQHEIAEHFGVAKVTVWRILKELDLSRKKNVGTS